MFSNENELLKKISLQIISKNSEWPGFGRFLGGCLLLQRAEGCALRQENAKQPQSHSDGGGPANKQLREKGIKLKQNKQKKIRTKEQRQLRWIWKQKIQRGGGNNTIWTQRKREWRLWPQWCRLFFKTGQGLGQDPLTQGPGYPPGGGSVTLNRSQHCPPPSPISRGGNGSSCEDAVIKGLKNLCRLMPRLKNLKILSGVFAADCFTYGHASKHPPKNLIDGAFFFAGPLELRKPLRSPSFTGGENRAIWRDRELCEKICDYLRKRCEFFYWQTGLKRRSGFNQQKKMSIALCANLALCS